VNAYINLNNSNNSDNNDLILEAFILNNAYPLVGEITEQNLQFYKDRKRDIF